MRARVESRPDRAGERVGGVRRELIITLAARHQLPAVYNNPRFVTDGGLISYEPELFDQHRRAGGYADRILKGEKPADRPVQAPTNYELVLILKTAKALGLRTGDRARARQRGDQMRGRRMSHARL